MLKKSFVVLLVIASGLLLSNVAIHAQAAQSAPSTERTVPGKS